jgi:hypothetical protein
MAINIQINNSEIGFMFGSVCYRGSIDPPNNIDQVSDVTPNIDSLVVFLSAITASGGADEPDDWIGRYRLAVDEIRGWVRKRSSRWRMRPHTAFNYEAL